MGFMKPFTYRGKFWLVPTTEGTELVPFDVETDWTQLGSLVTGEIVDVPEAREGWYGRLSAPGYLDCTDWSWADSEDELLHDMRDMYGDDDAPESEDA